MSTKVHIGKHHKPTQFEYRGPDGSYRWVALSIPKVTSAEIFAQKVIMQKDSPTDDDGPEMLGRLLVYAGCVVACIAAVFVFWPT